ncbi:universal stress protein [Planococcus lenghuensis]|uniref:Universal stress protein n=1 Tax=Planococcus lenghuensis TaxID=2213202 RepID=A0A1Q2L3A6_9BACL|nr:universal stress protein [Planococcus lenghuensis]AQQ54547.1 universal stress protein [Planococcus lenghuensis]
MYNSILLAVDGSDHSIRAAREAIKVASLTPDSKVIVVYVVDHNKAKDEVLQSPSITELDAARRKRLQPVEEALAEHNIDYAVKMLHGTPGPAIVEFANEVGFDILVIGSRGINALQEMVLGSVSHKVVKRAECPVLIVK